MVKKTAIPKGPKPTKAEKAGKETMKMEKSEPRKHEKAESKAFEKWEHRNLKK